MAGVLLGIGVLQAQAPTGVRGAVSAWVRGHQAAIVGELVDLLAIPNVAADRANIRRNAEHLRGRLTARGFTAEILETAGNPLVYGELRRARRARDRCSSTPTTTASRSTREGWKQPIRSRRCCAPSASIAAARACESERAQS